MRRATLRFARAVALLAALCAAGTTASAGDDEAARLLAAPEKAPDAERLRRAAEEALEKEPASQGAMAALLVAVTWLRDRDLLDDAIERAKSIVDKAGPDRPVTFRYGSALLRRARMDDPPDRPMLEAAAKALARVVYDGSPSQILDLAHAQHLSGDAKGARETYILVPKKATPADEDVAERAVEGLKNLLADREGAFETVAVEMKGFPVFARAWAEALERKGQLRNALGVLDNEELRRNMQRIGGAPRVLVARARLLRILGDHEAALGEERRAIDHAGSPRLGGGYVILDGVERLWRESRPLRSFEDCASLERDYDDLVKRAAAFPDRQIAWLNNLAFRLREVVSTYMWRGEGRTQGIAEGAPKEVAALLSHCTALYDGAVSLIPKDAADQSFERRWFYAGVLNDAGLMRHYFVDVRDLARAEALYLRAFELTDGAYMDTYFYNLQYLYGFELPGREETWLRLAQRAQTKILAESSEGGFVPDERKRDAARRDAEGLRRKVEERRK